MGIRFRKSIKLAPGVRLNISKSGVSTSLGVPGATVNVKPGRKARATVGLPGTGISYSTNIDERSAPASGIRGLWLVLLAAVVVAAVVHFA